MKKMRIFCPGCRGPMRRRVWKTSAVWHDKRKGRKTTKARIIIRRHNAYWCPKCKVGCRIIWRRFWH